MDILGLFLNNYEIIFSTLILIVGAFGGLKLKVWFSFGKELTDSVSSYQKSAEDGVWTDTEYTAFGKEVKEAIESRPFLVKKLK